MDHLMVKIVSMKSRKKRSRQVSLSEAKGQLTELVRRVEAGEEVVLTRHGHAAVRLVPVKAVLDRKSRRAILEAARASASSKATPGPNAARSQESLYAHEGLPGRSRSIHRP
jgi:prevent-host-death family protein